MHFTPLYIEVLRRGSTCRRSFAYLGLYKQKFCVGLYMYKFSIPRALYIEVFVQGLYIQEFCVGALYIEVLSRGSICRSFVYLGLYILEKFCVGALYIEVLCTQGSIYMQEKFCVGALCIGVLHTPTQNCFYIQRRDSTKQRTPIRCSIPLYIGRIVCILHRISPPVIQEGFCIPYVQCELCSALLCVYIIVTCPRN